MNQTQLMTLTMMIPTKISISSQNSGNYGILQSRTITIQIDDLIDLGAPWSSLLETFSFSYPQFNHQLTTLHDKAVL